jgi:hypothetical protein
MGEPIKIVVVADTMPAAADLKDFVEKKVPEISAPLKVATKHAKELTKGLGSNRMAMMELGHVARAMTDGIVAGIDPIRMLAMETPRIVQAVGTMGFSLAAFTPYLVAAGAAAAVFSLEWYAVLGGVDDGTKKIDDLVAALDKVPGILEKIQLFKNAGLLSDASAKEFSDYLGKSPRIPLYKRADGSLGRNNTETVEEFFHTGDPFKDQTTHDVQKDLAQASPAEVNDWVASQFKHVSEEQVKAKAKLKELMDRSTPDVLSGTDKLIAAEHERFEKLRQELMLTLQQSDSFVGPKYNKEVFARVDELKRAEASKIADLERAAAEKSSREQEASVGKIRAAERADVSERLRALEDELTEKQNADGVLRGQLSGVEYQERKNLAESFYFSGEIGEAEYTHLLQEAAKKRTVAEKAYRSELEKIAELQQTINRAQTEGKIRALDGNPLLSDRQRDAASVPLLQNLLAQNAAVINSLQGQYNGTTDKAAQLQIQQKINELMIQQVDLQNKIQTTQGASSFQYQFQLVKVQLLNLNNLARESAQTFGSVFNTAVQSISHGISGLIMGTRTWKQALSDIYNSIIGEIVQGIVQMGVRWVLTQVMMATVGRGLQAASVAASAPAAAASAAIWSPAATLATIATFGGAALAAPGFIGAAELSTMFGGAFADGGRPPMGRYSLVGERGPELFVPDTAGTILPADQTAALMSGGGGGSNVSIYSFTDMRAVQDHIERNDAHEKYIMDVVGKNLHRVRSA